MGQPTFPTFPGMSAGGIRGFRHQLQRRVRQGFSPCSVIFIQKNYNNFKEKGKSRFFWEGAAGFRIINIFIQKQIDNKKTPVSGKRDKGVLNKSVTIN